MAAEILGLSAESWSVVGTLVTCASLAVGAVAALVAALQYRHGRKIEIDQTRPDMVIYAEASPVSQTFIDIVIRNVGSTAATNLAISIDPPLARAAADDQHPPMEARIFQEQTEMWPPGYEMRMFFDSHLQRHGKGLPEQYTATLTYSDSRGAPWEDKMVIDFDMGRGTLYTEVYGMHHAAKALREIQTVLKASPMIQGDMAATIETRSEHVDRVAEERSERLAARDRLRQQAVVPTENPLSDGDPATP